MNHKKLLTMAAAVAFVLIFTVSVLAAGVPALIGGGGSGVTINLSEFSTLLDVSRQDGDDEERALGQYFKSYAFVEEGKDALRWNEIKAGELTVGLRWDVSNLIRKPGRLILSSASAGSNTATRAADCETADEDNKIGYAIYNITGIAPNPASIRRSNISYMDTDAYINIGAGNEWTKDGYIWRAADANGPHGEDTEEKWAKVALSTERQTIHVRTKADAGDANNITLPSLRSVRVTIPAMSRAPRVNIHLSQGLLSMRGGMEVSNDGVTWAKMTGASLPLGVVTELPASVSGNGVVFIDLNDMQDVHIRRPASRGRPPSDTFETRIKIRTAGEVSEDHFIAASDKKILIDSAIVMEAYMQGRWRRVREIAAQDVPSNGLSVRRAGAQDRMPGPERTLTLISYGEYQEISVT